MNIQMLNDLNGKTSETRVTKALVILTIIGVWAVLSVKNGYMLTIDPGVVGVIFTLVTGSSVKSFAEQREKQV